MITLVSVTYNAESTLLRTLQSVECQTYSNIEHIIMDGGSTDGTVSLAEAYKQRIGDRYSVIIVSEKDRGLYDAMNKALKIATGDFICFLNAGDKLHSSSVLAQVADVAHSKSVGVVYGDTDIVDDNGNFIRSRRLTPPHILTWCSFLHGMLVCHQSFYVNRNIAQEYDLSYRFSADFDWCIRCLKEGERKQLRNIYIKPSVNKGYVSDPRIVLTDYLSEGMTTANHRASLKERFHIMANHYGLTKTIIQHIWFVLRTVIKR